MRFPQHHPKGTPRRYLKNNEPADLAGFRARREELKRERSRKKARDNFTPYAPDYGREIPPRLNPDVPGMVEQIDCCYSTVMPQIAGFQDKIAELVDAGKLDSEIGEIVSEILQLLLEVVSENTIEAMRDWETPGFDVYAATDKVKYCYAIGTRELAYLQYFFAKLAGTGQLDPKENDDLQWGYCFPMWESLYHGTIYPTYDQSAWDGMWDWHANTYSDGRQIMTQIELVPREQSDYVWAHNGHLCGDGPIQEHPRGTVCHIAPVQDKDKGFRVIRVHLAEHLCPEHQ